MISAAFQALVQDNSPFALARAMVAGREQVVFRHGAKTLAEVYRKASRGGQLPFLVKDESTLTVQDLFARAAAYQAEFAARNIGKGARVFLAAEGDGDWIAAFIALTSIGATAVLAAAPGQICQAMATGCVAIVADDIQPVEELTRIGRPNEVGPERGCFFSEIDPEQEACIAFTSGSSGSPKGVVLTHRAITTGLMNMMLAGAAAARSGQRKPSGSRPVAPAVLLRTPFSHVSGYMQMLLMFLAGGRIVRSMRPDICALIADHQITTITGVTDDDIRTLIQTPEEALRPLRAVAVVGRNLPISLRYAVRQSLPNLGLGGGYGLTETCGLVCSIGNSELDARPGTVGPLLPTVDCRIVRKDGSLCVHGEDGEIQLRGAMLMCGYCDAKPLGDDWFSSGDIGYLTEDGYLHILDKENRFLRQDNLEISCREIEEGLREAAGISDVAVLSVQGASGDQLVVFAATEAELLPHLQVLLAEQLPKEIVKNARLLAMRQLPRTASGKIAYARLTVEAAT